MESEEDEVVRDEDEVVRDQDEVLLSGTRKRRFDQQQIASLTAYYNTGMKGEGEQYSSKINHAAQLKLAWQLHK